MTDSMGEKLDALLTLLDLAHADIAAVIDEHGISGHDKLRQHCINHLENILGAFELVGQDNLYLITDALLTYLGDDSLALESEQIAKLFDWFGDARIYAEMPSADLAASLLSPLPPTMRESLLPMLQVSAADTADAETSDAATDPENLAFPELTDGFPESNDGFPEAELTDTPPALEETVPEIDDDDMLGMLALELREVDPQLDRLACQLAEMEDAEAARSLVDGYFEILGRIEIIASELNLQGLAFICDFVRRNVDLILDLSGDARYESVSILRGWPGVVAEHLLNPEEDSRCLAVVDFLEMEAWPEPVPYRDQRELIEGLARSIEISNEFVAELREIEATAEDVSLEMSSDTSPELIEAFFAESPGHAETLSALTEAINQGVDVQQNIEAAQRIAHTLKGSGNLIGVKGIANISHHLEDIFEYVAKHKIQPPAPLAATMQEASDLIEAMLEALQGMVPPPVEAQQVLQDVLDWANRIDSGQMRGGDFVDAVESGAGDDRRLEVTSRHPSQPERRSVDQPERRSAENQTDVAADAEQVVAPVAEEFVRVPLQLLDNIFRIVGETAITAGQIQEHLNRLEGGEKLIRNNDGYLQQQRYELENLVSIRSMAAKHRGKTAEAEGDFDALEMDEYDEFYSATHAFIEAVTDSREIMRGFSDEVYELDSLFLEQQRLNKELQQMVMTTRMVPVSNIASRLQRAVRQVCRTTGKQAELSIIGQDLLLDGDVLNRLADPLMHMLRNAVDHGIEEVDDRFTAGKPPAGQIVLSFAQEGNNVVVECRDDGRGLDYTRIRETAIERTLLNAEDEPDHEELAKLILHPGFSTRSEVTHVSGRGVGMDVVQNTIQGLNGTMSVGDAEEGGTQIALRMPITLLTSHCLMAGVGKNNLYAIPTLSLTQILSPGIGFVENQGDGLRFKLEDEAYPAFTLNALIGSPDQQMIDHIDEYSVVLVQTANGIVAVVVERVVTSYDLVVKNMGSYVKSISGIAGVSMLGNGEVVPVLDLAAILQAQGNSDLEQTRANFEFDSTEDTDLPRVLIVDDSLSVRNSLAQLVRDSGYEAVLARDGLEAINIIRADAPDIVLTDLEMPRLNGFDLISYIRNTSEWKDLPVIMITSRNMAKHRQQAEAAGVSRFIAKPFLDDEILDCIETELMVSA